jgi:hypothetical protein
MSHLVILSTGKIQENREQGPPWDIQKIKKVRVYSRVRVSVHYLILTLSSENENGNLDLFIYGLTL